LAAAEKGRQAAVANAVEGCIRDGRIDLFAEWHQYWRPDDLNDLWAVGPRAAEPGLALLGKSFPEAGADLRARIVVPGRRPHYHDGPQVPLQGRQPIWYIRSERFSGVPNFVAQSFLGAPTFLGSRMGGYHFVLGAVRASKLMYVFLGCDGDVWNGTEVEGFKAGVQTSQCVVVCRGNFTASNVVGRAVVLVDGDVDLTNTDELDNSLIRATGRITPPKNQMAQRNNTKLEEHARDATSPYSFFELSDVGLSFADDEEGLVATGAKAGTPFGDCGLRRADLIVALDDAPAGGSEQFRKLVRRALVRQGDCLLTVARGDTTVDLPVFFPLPK
jgi:hypothetical protein